MQKCKIYNMLISKFEFVCMNKFQMVLQNLLQVKRINISLWQSESKCISNCFPNMVSYSEFIIILSTAISDVNGTHQHKHRCGVFH